MMSEEELRDAIEGAAKFAIGTFVIGGVLLVASLISFGYMLAKWIG